MFSECNYYILWYPWCLALLSQVWSLPSFNCIDGYLPWNWVRWRCSCRTSGTVWILMSCASGGVMRVIVLVGSPIPWRGRILRWLCNQERRFVHLLWLSHSFRLLIGTGSLHSPFKLTPANQPIPVHISIVDYIGDLFLSDVCSQLWHQDVDFCPVQYSISVSIAFPKSDL